MGNNTMIIVHTTIVLRKYKIKNGFNKRIGLKKMMG